MRAVVVLELDLPDEPNTFAPVLRALNEANIPHLAYPHVRVGTGSSADQVLAVFAPTTTHAPPVELCREGHDAEEAR